jgi:hypothetical protein
MQNVSNTVDPHVIHDLLAKVLAQFEESTDMRGDGLWLSKWPSVRFSVDRAIVFPSTAVAWIAWVDVTCMYNTTVPFTAARTHVIGLGAGKAEALFDAIENWRKAIAPALISFIYGFLKGDAETWPPDHPRSVPGWSCINGPYLLRGDSNGTGPLTAFLQEHPLVGPVREHLGHTLDKSAPLHTVALYRVQTSSGPSADVLIDNQQDNSAGEILKTMIWPKELDGSEFISARHFLLCVSPK